MFFWNSLAFLMIHRMLAISSLVPPPFLNPVWTSGSSRGHVLLKTGLENFEHYFASVWNECNCEVVWTFFGISFLWDCNENWPFPVLWPLLSFPNSLAYRVQSAAGILSSAGILSAAYWVHGITQAGMLEWFAISSSRDLPNPGIELRSPDLAGRFFNTK